MRSVRGLAITIAAGALAMVVHAPSASGAFGDTSVLAPFPADPGFPEGVTVRDGRVYAGGAATFGTTGAGPSAVLAYDRATGAIVRRYDVVGEDTLSEHGGSSMAFDGNGRLYFLNTQLGTLRINTATGAQEVYSGPFPDLSPCVPLVVAAPCSPTLPANLPPLPNDIAFAANGDAYVTDSFQATIWRIPSGGGAPQIWFQDRRFASTYVGTNGLRFDLSGTSLYVTVTVDLKGAATLYRIPFVSSPTAGQLQVVHRFAAGELPDGIAVGSTGDIYVAMATPAMSGVRVLRPDGSERARILNPQLSPFAPFDGPANLAFDGAGHILLTNHAPVTGLALRMFAILDTDVQDPGMPLFAPLIP